MINEFLIEGNYFYFIVYFLKNECNFAAIKILYNETDIINPDKIIGIITHNNDYFNHQSR